MKEASGRSCSVFRVKVSFAEAPAIVANAPSPLGRKVAQDVAGCRDIAERASERKFSADQKQDRRGQGDGKVNQHRTGTCGAMKADEQKPERKTAQADHVRDFEAYPEKLKQ